MGLQSDQLVAEHLLHRGQGLSDRLPGRRGQNHVVETMTGRPARTFATCAREVAAPLAVGQGKRSVLVMARWSLPGMSCTANASAAMPVVAKTWSICGPITARTPGPAE